jgi:hypothetical protein
MRGFLPAVPPPLREAPPFSLVFFGFIPSLSGQMVGFHKRK